MHPLLHQSEESSKELNDLEEIRPLPSSMLWDVLSDADPDLKPILQQLESHLMSIESNHAQTAGLEDIIAEVQAALYSRLNGHMSQSQHDLIAESNI